MVITEIVLMKNSFKCSNYVKKERERERRGQKKCYFRSTLTESFNKFSLLKKTLTNSNNERDPFHLTARMINLALKKLHIFHTDTWNQRCMGPLSIFDVI